MQISYTVELERLLLAVEPKLTEQVTAAKELTEKEIGMLVQKFSVMNQELKQVLNFAEQIAADQCVDLDKLKGSVSNIRKEIDGVLHALQFQDRVSQILGIAHTSLATVRETLEHIQQQGPERHENMLSVEQILSQIDAQYETVKHCQSETQQKPLVNDFIYF